MLKPSPYTWTTKNGTTIDVSDMDDRHLINAISYLDRKISFLVRGDPYGESEDVYGDVEIQEGSDTIAYYALLQEAAYRFTQLKS